MTEDKFFRTFKKPKSDIEQIEKLIFQFGEKTTLGEVLDKVNKKSPYKHLKHRCPKCHGKGYTVTEYNGYPSGLPDSWCVYEAAYDYQACDLCDGMGWTETERKPIVEEKIVGYR